MGAEITIVDCGRGLQLSTCRITVQDLVPYLQQSMSHEEIRRWIPVLTLEEIAIVARYYREHQAELDEQDQRIRQRTEERVRQQRLRFPEPEGTIEERKAHLHMILAERRLGKTENQTSDWIDRVRNN